MIPWFLAGLEGLDDDHRPTAAGAGLGAAWRFIGVGSGLVLGRGDLEQLAGPGQVLGAPAVGEQAVVANAVEA